jgi:hypothetical protein
MVQQVAHMDHHSRFDQLVTATEELVHENERVRAKFKAFEAALREYLKNQRNCCALRSLAGGLKDPASTHEPSQGEA